MVRFLFQIDYTKCLKFGGFLLDHIFLWDNKWHVIRIQEYTDTTMNWRDFNANVGTESTVTVDGTDTR